MEDITTDQQIVAIAESVSAATKQRHFLAVFFLSFIWGVFGVDRFYLGKTWTGILKLLTFGGIGVWAAVDLSLIMSGLMLDKQGNKMLEYDKYKGFAKKTVALFMTILIITVLIVGALTTYELIQFFQNDGFQKLQDFVTGGSIPGIDQLQKQLQQLQGSNINNINLQ